MPHGKLRAFLGKRHLVKHNNDSSRSGQGDQPIDESSSNHASAPVTKPDLWQRAFDDLEPKEQQLIKSIMIPKSNQDADSSSISTDAGVVGRLQALNGVVDTVKTQYEIDQRKSKIKEPTQKIIKAVLSFQDLIQIAVGFDPTGHATSVWAVVSLGLTMTQNYRSQKLEWLESCVFLADVLTRYGFVEGEYQKDPNTDQHVEMALVQVYVAVLTFAAQVQSLYDRSRVVFIWKGIFEDSLSDLQNSIDEAESHLGQWLNIVDRREQRDIFEKANKILTNIDQVIDSLHEMNNRMVLAELKVVEGARYSANTGDEYEECLEGTQEELLHNIRGWATDLERRAVFLLQGMAGTGKSTVSRTVARWLEEEGLLGGSFFFKKGETDRDDAKRLFTTLTKQILERLPHLQDRVKTAIKEIDGIATDHPQKQFNELLFKPLKDLDLGLKSPLVLVVVIDALDECQKLHDVAAFCSTLPKLNDLENVQLRFFITSRPEPLVIERFRRISHDGVILHHMEQSIIERDISIFLDVKLEGIKETYDTKGDWPGDWPGEETHRDLVNKAVPLFIYAATIIRFIASESPRKRLQAILSSSWGDKDDGIDDEYVALSSVYSSVLRHIISRKQPRELEEWMDEFRRIVGTIVILFSPLPSISLSKLISLDHETVQGKLSSLRSVLSVPEDSDETAPVRIFHLSFREFLVFRRSASAEFWIDEQAGHTQLENDCIDCMTILKRDMCCLSNPGARRHDIEQNTLDNHVPPELQYACRYWIRHLENSDQGAIHWTLIEKFLKLHFLHWLEVMSLFGWVSETIGNIQALQSMAKSPHIIAFLEDGKRFILKNRQIADEAPLQVYCAGLIFAPQNSIIRSQFEEEVHRQLPQISQLPIVEENWGAELQVLEGHSRSVGSVAFSPDSRLLASGSNDGTVRLWDPITGDLQLALDDHSDAVVSVAFSPDGCVLATGSGDGTIQLWSPVTGDLQQTLEGHVYSVRSLVFSRNSQLLASGSYDKTIIIWDPVTGNLQHTLEAHSEPTHRGYIKTVESVAFSPDSQLLASGFGDKNIRLWNPVAGYLQRTLRGHLDSVQSVVFSPDGCTLASGSRDNTIRLWDPVTGHLRRILEGHLSAVESVAFSIDGRLLASGSSDKSIRLWDPVTGNLQHTLVGHSDTLHTVTFSPDGQLLASGSEDSTIRLWDLLAIGGSPQTCQPLGYQVKSIVFSPDGQLLASSSGDKNVRIWVPATGKLEKTLKGHLSRVGPVTFSPDSRLLASGSYDETVRLWDPLTGDPKHILNGHLDWVRSIIFSTNGQVLAASSADHTIRLWDPVSGSLCQVLEGHSGTVVSIAFSSDSRLLASGAEDNTVRIWDPVTGHLQQTLKTHATVHELEFSQDGSYLITDLGILQTQSQLGSDVSASTYGHGKIFIEEGIWINLEGKDVLWLPPYFRPVCSATHEDFIALGHGSGRVSFLRFSL